MTTATIGNNTGDTYAGTDDTWLSLLNPTTNNDGVSLETNKYAVGNHGNTVIRFTGLSSIAPTVTVSAASVWLYLTSSSGSETHDARPLLRNWVEAQATWNIYSTSNNWTTAGALSDGNDRSATVCASANLTAGSGLYVEFTGAGLAQVVQDWINGVTANHGLVFERNGAGDDTFFKIFVRSEGTDAQRPYLAITYTTAAGAVGGIRRALLGIG